ncbi:hypothetical protein [Acinetobacter sp. A47]|uniref:hypothetical protein n=1 Tax=Acinetobacter sp. A47 TaxID=1561217 RepID=UPI001269ABFA|nr:hypothetical protein [Acinetobacter sp. A47]
MWRSQNGFMNQNQWMPQLTPQYTEGYSPFGTSVMGNQLFGDGTAMPAANQVYGSQFMPGAGEPTGLASAWSKFQDSSLKDQASAIGATVGALANGYQAYNSVKTAKGQLAFAKDSWNKNFEAQRKTTNASLADRQAARVASNPNGYQSVDSYMKKYGI